ncbi:MAG TPA: FMN-dependent NADH-azoreductase [Rhodospirillaceae bacterium]|nr:FMN-dependent NADH-azoreductase [Rhodospirillaceae bacterium]MAX63229.1 FMN-dependent NADH-azoreductase [Rhodospirillaceae bacterium]MBB59472.1 FMN-dependent NADH-azoreductase [Rhodospirillaceae bacterium]HAJ20546.1 FMN-dependent NADH-azoreductase [Rhodospirillaceae bacterium]HBM11089.1 FMN-dependent NADH-azoreductase [Rhodospirillaceae bacterium]|tara:strand:- start:5916 stop:6530 length:615 start_codon:yes stop_codon:yes gene_type:complete
MSDTSQKGSKVLKVLRVDSSARAENSTTRKLTESLLSHLSEKQELDITLRNVAEGLPFVSPDWVGANFTDPADRNAEQQKTLAQSDALIAEVQAADVLVIGVPVYNFGVPAALKAWIDMIARARETFKYTETGPVGLVSGKKAYLVVASGGTEVGSGIDFATPYMKHILSFIGVTDVTVIAAGQQMMDEKASEKAEKSIEALAA